MTDSTTLLELIGIGVPPYSARGLTQTLAPIDIAAQLRRTINGDMLDMSSDQFRKFKSTITGNDQQPPAFDGVWGGQIVVVDCIAELCCPEYATPSRDIVAQREESGFIFYRPRLVMVVMGFDTSTDEYGAQIGWTLELEEK